MDDDMEGEWHHNVCTVYIVYNPSSIKPPSVVSPPVVIMFCNKPLLSIKPLRPLRPLPLDKKLNSKEGCNIS